MIRKEGFDNGSICCTPTNVYKTYMHSSLLILCNSDMQWQDKISESCVDMVYHCMFGVYISLFQGREGRERERERETHTHTHTETEMMLMVEWARLISKSNEDMNEILK